MQKRTITERLKDLGFDSYEEYLQGEHWRSLRAKRIGPASRCHVCRGRRVQLHHTTYVRVGAERASDLVTLCSSCHREVHRLVEVGGASLSNGHAVLLRRRQEKGSPKRGAHSERVKARQLYFVQEKKRRKAEALERRQFANRKRRGKVDPLEVFIP